MREPHPHVDDSASGDARPSEEPRVRDLILLPNPPVLDPSGRWERIEPKDFQVPRYIAESMPMHLDPDDWNTGFLSVRERELPAELYEDLRQLTPQASLRDLHRPVSTFQVVPEEIEGSRLIGRWKEGAEDVKLALKKLEPLPQLDQSLREVASAQRRSRDLRSEPWRPLLDDEAPRRRLHVHPAEE